jgi:hypothetical protein
MGSVPFGEKLAVSAAEWESRSAMDADCVAILTAAVCADPDAAMEVLENLSSGQLIALCWVLAGWWSFAWERGHNSDKLAALRKIGLAIATTDDEGD